MTATPYEDVIIPDTSDDIPPDTRSGLECEKCGSQITWGGRGRKPKRCHDCRAVRSTTSKDSTQDRSRKGALRVLEENLTAQIYSLGSLIAMFDRFDGVLIAKKSDRLASALTDVASANPKIMKALQSGVEMSGWAQVAVIFAEVALPIMAHHNLIPGVPDPASQLFNGNGNGASNV